MTQNHFVPLGRDHLKLREVVSGKTDFDVDVSRAADFFDSEPDEESIAEQLYQIECKANSNPFVKVVEPARVNGMFKICKVLTDEGDQAFKELELGWVVSCSSKTADVKETIKFYDDMISEGNVRQDLAALVIANKDERLRDLRSRLTLYRMAGEKQKDRDGEYIVPIKD